MSHFFPKDRHRKDRSRQRGELSLLAIPGVGRRKAQALINAGFRSIREVAEAPLDNLKEVPGLGPDTAERLRSGARQALAELSGTARPGREGRVVRLQRVEQASDAAVEPEPVVEREEGDDTVSRINAEESLAALGRQLFPSKKTDEAPRHGTPVSAEPKDPRQLGDEVGAPISGAVERRDDESEPVATAHAEPVEQTPTIDRVGARAEPVEIHLTIHVDSNLLATLDPEVAREFEVFPLQVADGTLVVAADRELPPEQVEDLSREAGMPVKVIPSQVANAHATLKSLYDDNALRSRPKGLGEILIDMNLLTPDELRQGLAQQMRENNPAFQPVLSVDSKTLQLIPEAVARRYNVLPLSHTENGVLLAASEHLETEQLHEIQRAIGRQAQTVLVGPSELQEAMAHCYRARQRHELRQMWLGEILISRGLVTRKQLDACLAAQQESTQKLGQLLIENGHISEDALYPILAEKLGLEYRRFQNQDFDYQLTYLVSERFAERNFVLPVKLDQEHGVLEVAVSDPTNLQVRDMLEGVAESNGLTLKLILATPSRLQGSISYVYNFQRQMEMEIEELEIEAETDWEGAIDRSDLVITEELPKMRRIVNKLLYEAVTEGASDVHIENLETRTLVRFRVDGILHERTTPISKSNIQKLISVLKIDSGLNIAERRRAQDGVFKMRIGKNRNIDFRINVHATEFGEDAVIRVLDRSRNLMGLDQLGFGPAVQGRYEALVKNPQGLILITGPTGSGKTTTLYSTLSYLNTGDQKIVTAEDPVEYHLDGITQYQVNDFIGNTFAEYTRRFLRKDPDIILVGEIRDDETALACIRAAMTGHLVFSTLHTNDAIGVVQRLRDLGLDSSSIADALLCVIQQRLARRNCPDCRKPYQPDSLIMKEFYPHGELPPEAHFVRGTGCTTCHGQGLKGRVGLYEFWEIKRQTREIIASGSDEAAIRTSAGEQGMTPIVEDALRKVYDGTTTLEDLRRVVPVEQIRGYSGYYRP